jgi:hypothetical protein
MINMTEVIANVTLSKVCSIRADEDSTVKKNINLKVKFDGTTLQSVFDKAVSGAVIAWQNGVGRKNFDTYKAGQVVEIQFSAPASKTQIDPEVAMVAKLASMTPVEQVAYLQEMIKKATPASTEEAEEAEEDKTEDEKA